VYPSTSVSYDIAQARIADLRHQAQRESLARSAMRSAQPRVPGRLRFRSVLRHRPAVAAS